MTACVGSNLDPFKWEKGDYPNDFKAKIIAYYELTQIIRAHVEDARIRKQENKQKRKPRGR